MRTRKLTMKEARSLRKRQRSTFSKSSEHFSSSARASRSRRVAALPKGRKVNLQNSVTMLSSGGTRKRKSILIADKGQSGKCKKIDYSPIKTRGLYKKQVRGTEHCRLCKTNVRGFMTCSVCQTKYHLECLRYTVESVRLVSEKRSFTWLCPMCVYCCTCNQLINDPENVQCFACDRAFHGACRPASGIFLNPKDAVSQWLCPQCTYLTSTENIKLAESTLNNLSLASSQMENELSEKRTYLRSSRHDRAPSVTWKIKLQAERNVINDQLKDLYGKYLEDKNCKQKEPVRCVGREGFSSRKKLRFSAKSAKKVRRSDSEFETAKNITVINGVKFSTQKERNFLQDLSESEKQRAMKEISTASDFDLYMIAKREFMATQPSEDMNAGGKIPPQTQWIQFGPKRMLAMHASPYPKRIAQSTSVYICQFCLTAFEDVTTYEIHQAQCEWHHPPGNEIYRENGLSFWEIDGVDEIVYCRKLCLLSKLFLVSKTLYHEVETFFFYILTEHTSEGHVFLGYFSKEKNPSKNNNLSCLLTLPSFQRTGYGKFLIDLSYKLSLRERKIGGPEHPLSDMGLITYRSYWKAVIISYIRSRREAGSISIKEMSNETGIHSSDIISTMLDNKMLKYRDGNYMINKKKALTAPLYMFRRRVVHNEKLVWQPEFDIECTIKMGTYVD